MNIFMTRYRKSDCWYNSALSATAETPVLYKGGWGGGGRFQFMNFIYQILIYYLFYSMFATPN